MSKNKDHQWPQTWARTGGPPVTLGDHWWPQADTPDRKAGSQWFECLLYCRWCWVLSRLPVLCYLQLGTVLPSWILWRKFCETSDSTAKSVIYRPSALNKILTKTSVWLSVHVFCGCSKLLKSLRKELSLSAGKRRSLQAGFTQCLLNTHPHRVQVPMTHLRARRFCLPWNPGLRAPQQTSAGCKGCDQLSPAVYHAGSWHIPQPLCPSLWLERPLFSNLKTKLPHPLSIRRSLQRSRWNPKSMGLSFGPTEHARGQL